MGALHKTRMHLEQPPSCMWKEKNLSTEKARKVDSEWGKKVPLENKILVKINLGQSVIVQYTSRTSS